VIKKTHLSAVILFQAVEKSGQPADPKATVHHILSTNRNPTQPSKKQAKARKRIKKVEVKKL